MPNKLHFYTKYSKEKIKISDKPFASGGEGAIYAIASPRSYRHLVAKIYYPEKRTPEREAKMHYLMQHPPITFQKGQPPSIGWVQDLIYKEQRFLGILLIGIEGKKLTKLTLAKLPRRADKAWERFAFQSPDAIKLRLRTCFNLAVVIYQIHDNGQYVLVDLKPDNVLMQPNGLLAVVDMDSVEVIENGKAIFAAPVATPEYTPPEHYIGERTIIDETWDRFSLGVIFYQLLLGLHPFAAMSHPPYDNLVSIHDKIQQDLFVHHPDKKEFFKVIPPPHQRYDLLPMEVQELFQDCFTRGATKPFSRPSALDWCISLARLLNLPFKGKPHFNLPHKTLPNIDFKASECYFIPELFKGNLGQKAPYNPSYIDIIHLEKIKSSITEPIEQAPSPTLIPSIQKRLREEMEESYKGYLKSHRGNLQVVLRTLIPIIIISISFPWILILGAILLFFAFPKLMFRKSNDVIHSIGKIVLPSSTDNLSIKQDSLLAFNKEVDSNIQILENKKEGLKTELNQFIIKAKNSAKQHLELARKNSDFLSVIKQKRNAQQVLIDDILSFNTWVEKELKIHLKNTQTAEIQAHTDLKEKFSNQFLVQLQAKKSIIKNTFRDFNNKQFKLEKKIALLKSKLSKIRNESIKEQMFKDYTTALDANNIYYEKELETYREINQKLLPVELESFLPLEELNNKLNIQLKYNKRKQKRALKKAKKKLGNTFQVDLESHLNLLYNSGEVTNLYFAHNKVQEQFDLFKEEIYSLNLKEDLEHQLSSLFITEDYSRRVINSKSTSSILSILETQQIGMQTEWNAINKGLQKLKNKILLFRSNNNPGVVKKWIKEVHDIIINIQFNQNSYHQFQEVFYQDSILYKIRTGLQEYRKIKQMKQDLEDNHAKEVLLLDEKNHLLSKDLPVSEERKHLNEELKLYQEDINVKRTTKAKEITLNYEQELVELENRWLLETNKVQKELKVETEHLNQVKIDFGIFKDSIKTMVLDAERAYPKALKTTQLKFDSIYKEYQVLYQEKLKLAENNYTVLMKNKASLITLVEEHRQKHLINVAYSSIYHENLDKIEALENEIQALSLQTISLRKSIDDTVEEKIKVDTLIKWQEDFSTKIYIKDLLLKKVEQFREEEDKEV